MIEELLYSHLNADSNLLVSGNIFPQKAPSNQKVPYLVFTIINELDNIGKALRRTILEKDYRVQIDCYHASSFEAKKLKDRVKASLYKFKYLPKNLSARDGFDSRIDTFKQMIDFKLTIPGENCE